MKISTMINSKVKVAGILFATVVIASGASNIGLVRSAQNLFTQDGKTVKLVDGANMTLQVEGTLQTDGALNSEGLLTTDAGLTHSNPNATSTTATSYTLVKADVANKSSVVMTPNTGTLTVTGHSSSTDETTIPNAGDWFEQCWYNATTTSGVLITFADGTGTNFNTASSTYDGSEDLSIDAGEMACLKYLREPNTDILIGFQKFYDN